MQIGGQPFLNLGLYIRMPLGAAHKLAAVVLGEAAGSESDTVVELHFCQSCRSRQ